MGLLNAPAVQTHDAYTAKIDDILSRSHKRLLNRLSFIPNHVSDETYQHPFAGFIPRPDSKQLCGPAFRPNMCVTNKPRPINRLGLYDDEFSLEPPPGTVRIGITGGSVANLLVQASREKIMEELAKYPVFSGKKLEVLNLAIPGYKQPQQANMLLYIVSLGYKFDAIVNLGGLNEIYLSRRWNIVTNMSFAYPYGVHWFPSPPPVANQSDSGDSPRVVRAETLLTALVTLAPRNALAHSAFIRWLTLVSIDIAEKKVLLARQEFEVSGTDALFTPSGREYLYGSVANKQCHDPLCIAERVHAWEAGAAASAMLLKYKGIRYVEILQPNHYVVDRSVISEDDIHRMTVDDFGWLQIDTDAWQMMRDSLARMQQNGIQTADLSKPYIFKGIKSTLTDTCCHLTLDGYDRLAARIAEVVAQSWQPPKPIR
jgi:hypothetical protein